MRESKHTGFSSKLGVIMAAAGSAVGLGNIWKFPYVAGENGGGIFLIIYLVCVLLFGMPLVTTELVIGKRSRKSAYGAFRALRNNDRWQWLSWLCVVTAVLIMGFYFVVTGWCINYLAEAVMNAFKGFDAAQLTAHFQTVTTNTWRVILVSVIPVILTGVVLWFDVNKGIERLSKILMPLLLVMMVIMVVRVLLLDGSKVGLEFFFKTDFSQLSPKVVLVAMGQCFFSLSIGMGALITYGAYMPENQDVPMTSLQVVVLDTIVAVMAGMMIFPAVFAFGFNPAEGPELVFVVLPAIFEQMSFAWLSGVLFFTLLCIAALTSTISLMEVVVAFLVDATSHRPHPLDRRKSVLVTSAMAIALLLVCVLVPNTFDIFAEVTSCYLMPIGALAMSILVGWFLGNSFTTWYGKFFVFTIRWLVPIAIVLIFLNSLRLL